jgi:hypothetical protein
MSGGGVALILLNGVNCGFSTSDFMTFAKIMLTAVRTLDAF